MYKTPCLLAVLALAFSVDADAQAVRSAIRGQIPAEQAIEFVDREGTVCGKVESVRHAQNSSGEPTFLYMGGDFPRHTFSVRIWGKDRDKFRPEPEALAGKVLCATGRIARASGRAEIVVVAPSSLALAAD
ncbi:MAG: hypothetical protein ACK4RW_03615 [Rehaibacterium terrae]|uniref:hypothetical protein n=1 Tax=Rehaibacterium terrae TaxID=1341696 RepID=UPI00391C4AE0